MNAALNGRIEAVAEGRSADGRPRLFHLRSDDFDAVALYGQPWADVDALRRGWSVAVERRIAACRDVGARLCWLLAPDAHGVHADELPHGLGYATPSLADRFVELFGHRAEIDIVHPREALKAARGPLDVHRRTDSHWTGVGAYAAYRMVMERVGAGARVVGPHEVRWRWRDEVGDLGCAFDPPRRDAEPYPEILQPRARVTVDRVDEARRALKIFEVDDPSLPSCVVARDSFATAMAPFLAESFRRTVMVGADSRFFPELIHEERPDVVLVERAERALPFGAIDWALLTWREVWPDPGADAEADALDLEARRRLAEGDAPGALEWAERALAREPTPDRRLTAGRARLQLDDAEGADAAFRAALEGAPARWSFLMHLGIARLRRERFAEARDLFARACAVAPWHPLGFEHFGFAALALGEGEAAEPALRVAVRLGPENAGAHVWLAELLRARGDLAGARRAADAGLATCPGEPVLEALGRALGAPA